MSMPPTLPEELVENARRYCCTRDSSMPVDAQMISYLQSKQKVEGQLRELSQQGFFIASALPSWMWGSHDATAHTGGAACLRYPRSQAAACSTSWGQFPFGRTRGAGMLRVAEGGHSSQRKPSATSLESIRL